MKRYKVIGTQPVLGRQPDETFDAVIGEDQEEFLIGIGAIKIISQDVKADGRISDSSSKPDKKA